MQPQISLFVFDRRQQDLDICYGKRRGHDNILYLSYLQLFPIFLQWLLPLSK